MSDKQSAVRAVIGNASFGGGVFELSVEWGGTPPRAGQFFLIKAERSAVLLGRPISVFRREAGIVRFLIMEIGAGTRELAGLRAGDGVLMTGPLGNGWGDFLQDEASGVQSGGKPLALVSGGLGCAPLMCFADELSSRPFRFLAGFPTTAPRLSALIAAPEGVAVATDDGSDGTRGVVTDILEPERYAAVFSCGTPAMLKAVAEKCAASGTPCFVSTENRMACGVGACLGCTIRTTGGNKRCCADGPVFNAKEVVFG
jgi:NAD(P)H-flavin reductase